MKRLQRTPIRTTVVPLQPRTPVRKTTVSPVSPQRVPVWAWIVGGVFSCGILAAIFLSAMLSMAQACLPSRARPATPPAIW
jgi:hypothetical protein